MTATETGPSAAGGPSPDHTERYGPDALHLVDLFAARGDDDRDGAARGGAATGGADGGEAGRGLVILLHGGFWRRRWDRTHLYPMAAALAAEGWTVALPEYRRVGDPGGGWPGTGDDVLRLLEAVPPLVRARWGAAVAERIVLVGHSAGGHLALWSQTQEATVHGVVSLAGVLDLDAAHRARLSDGAVAELLGGAGAPGGSASDRDAESSGGAGAAGFAASLEAVDTMRLPVPEGPAITLVHGALDDEVPVSYSRAYAARDERIRLAEIADAGHYEVIDPTSRAWPTVLAALDHHR
ncbi:alpha/beta hydrolase family protein [Herbiconiux liukaitaii]|uniref:alpha/beta hydrolase family protein n=1 Tax=Herbiconiux liukaitaii TaxID=3342799 RepID=UPI0035BAEC2E